MANQNKLKAWVRYDGTGRVIAGGPILQRFKPAVGNWVEINANECCNEIPTTTTTTTQGGGGVTPTAFIRPYWTSLGNACSIPATDSLLFYSTSTTIEPITTFVFANAALTEFLPAGTIINASLTYPRLQVLSGGYLQVYNCPSVSSQNTIYSNNTGEVCSGIGSSTTIYWNSGSSLPFAQLYIDAALTIPYDASTYGTYLKLYFNAQDNQCQMSGTSGIISVTPC
jgi:hypothetical protein